MADEVKPEEVTKPAGEGATPAFDPEKMRTMMREELQQAMATENKDREYDANLQQQQQQVPQPSVNPLQAVIDPLLAPHIQRATLAAEGARDAATFYVGNAEAVKYQGDIEKAFNALLAQGTPFTRQAVWEWYKGKNFDKFLQEARTTDQKKVEDAKNIVDGGGGVRPGGGIVKQAHDATDEELKNALANVTF